MENKELVGICPYCGTVATVEEWDKATLVEFSECITLSDAIETDTVGNLYFCCPHCEGEVDGDDLDILQL